LSVLVVVAVSHRIEEEDDVEDVDIRQMDLRREFSSFVRKFKHSKGSLRSNGDVKKRYNIFARNVKNIKAHNKKHDSFRMEVNEFADLSLRERSQFTGLGNLSAVVEKQMTRRSALQLREAAPSAYDHRDEGHVSPVTNQGDCGSCWSYGVVYPLEGEVAILSGKDAPVLSNQQILSCAYEDEEDRNGCNGGWYMDGWDYTKKSGHLTYMADEPYLGIDMHCDPDVLTKPNGLAGYRVTGYDSVPQGDDASLALFSSKHVLAVAVESLGLFFYESGIFRDEYCEKPAAVDHAVNLVGYSTDAWIVKNSWGETWGEKGYVRMARDLPSHCGIADYAYFPLVERITEEE